VDRRAGRQAGWQANLRGGRQEGRQACARTGRRADKEVLRNSRAGIGLSADRQKGRHAGGQARKCARTAGQV
jgi:hypothetical protein